jgi:hypothetical protein
MGKRAGCVVCFHDDTQMIFIHDNSAWEVDDRVASNAKINTDFRVFNSSHGAYARLGATVNRKGKYLLKELKEGFGKSK